MTIFLVISTICLFANFYVLSLIQKVYINRNRLTVVSKGNFDYTEVDPKLERFIFHGILFFFVFLIAIDSVWLITDFFKSKPKSFFVDGILGCITLVFLIWWEVKKKDVKTNKRRR